MTARASNESSPAPAAAPDSEARRSRWWAGQLALTVVLSAYLGVAGSFWQAEMVHLGPVPVPYGLLAGLALTATMIAGATAASASRLGGLVALAAWLLPVLALGGGRPEGDRVLVAAPASLAWSSYAWSYGGLLLAAAVLAVPVSVWRRRRDRGGAHPGPRGQ